MATIVGVMSLVTLDPSGRLSRGLGYIRVSVASGGADPRAHWGWTSLVTGYCPTRLRHVDSCWYQPRCTLPEDRPSDTFGRASSLKLLVRANLLAVAWCARLFKGRAQNLGPRQMSRPFKYYYANFLTSFLSFKLYSLPPKVTQKLRLSKRWPHLHLKCKCGHRLKMAKN